MIATEYRRATALLPTSTKMKDRKFVSEGLLLTADLLELLTGDESQSLCYRQSAALLRQAPELLSTVPTLEDLAAIAGITTDVLQDATDLLTMGDTDLLMRLRERIPASVREMLSLQGLGPKRLRIVWKELKITDMAALSHAVTENQLVRQKGFGPKTQAKVKHSLLQARCNGTTFLLSDLRPLATMLEHELRELLGANARFDLTGEYRRGCTICNGIEMLVDPDHYNAVLVHLIRCEHYEIMTAGADMLLARVRDTQIPLTFHFKGANYYLELFRTTGSAEHVQLIEVDPQQLYRTEAEVYAAAGLPYLPANLREGKDEIRLALRGRLPKLVHHTDICGLLHAHTTASDGSDALEAMALHCSAMGMQYLGVSDHGPHHPSGQGMRLDAIRAQHKEIDRLNQRLAPFKILKGVELDILQDGSLGMSSIELSSFDFVIASMHEESEMSVAEATMRLVRAIRNPYTTILGHATGRMLFGKASYPVNMEAVIETCASENVVIELNCNPQRMDLDWKWIRIAVEHGVKVAINPNAHSASALHDYENGISMARKGLLGPAQTFNAMPLEHLENYLMERRSMRIH